MKLMISSFVLLFSIMQISSQEISGSWQGNLDVQGANLKIVFHINKQDNLYTSLLDSPTQGAFGIATTKTSFKEGKLEIVIANIGAFYQGTLKKDTIKGTFTQGGMPFPLTLARSNNNEPLRPQTPQKPYPYSVEEITFRNKEEKITLAGTLTLPTGDNKNPAVILLNGSGPNDRDESLFGHKPFWVLADYLTRQGIAVLRYAKRGVGKSEGEYFTSTTEDFANDAAAAFQYLKSRSEIDTLNIGLIGHSEGGVIAPMVANKYKNVSFIILMAGMGITGTELPLAQHQAIFDKTSLSAGEKEKLNQLLIGIYESVTDWTDYVGTDKERSKLEEQLSVLWQHLPIQTQKEAPKDIFVEKTMANIASPWFRYFLKINPQDYLMELKIPVLAINGENDTQVNYKTNLTKIEEALKKADNKNYTIKSYPQLNHLFQESETGEIREYGKIKQTISPTVLQDITNWIHNQVN